MGTINEKLEQVVKKIDPQARLLRTWTMEGGFSTEVTAFEIERPDGQTKKMVVRRHGEGHHKHRPQVAANEFRLLQIMQSVGLATPAPCSLDESGEIFSTPYIAVEYIEGETEFAPSDLDECILQLATHLSRIHQVDTSNADLSFLPQQAEIYSEKFSKRPERVDESIGEGRILDVLESVWPLPQRNESVLLHGDFWPGNVLWRDGRLVAVIDWGSAQVGDPLDDLGNSRLEMLWAFGIDAMHDFTHHYRSMTTIDSTNLPYWDLCAALRPAFKMAEYAGDPIIEKKMREGHRQFVAQAFEKLSLR